MLEVNVTIHFSDLNEPDYIVNRRNLKSLDISNMTRSTYTEPSFGIYSNSGSIKFIDIDKTILNYAESLKLSSGIRISGKIVDKIEGVEEDIFDMWTNDWNYDNSTKEVTVSISDSLEEWQEERMISLPFDAENPHEIIEGGKASNLYEWLKDKTPFKFQKFANLDEATSNRLESYIIPYPILLDGSIWEQWTKFCESTGTYLYRNKIGEIVCVYSKGA